MTEIFKKMFLKTEGHRCIAFYAAIGYVFFAIAMKQSTDAGAISALLLLYGTTQAKDTANNYIFKAEDKGNEK